MRATRVDATSATIKATPSGMSRRPSMPDRKNSGMKLAMMMSDELRMGRRTSAEARYTTLTAGSRSPSGRARFCLSRLYTFSTSTMASSTSEPMAMAMPPRLMVLTVYPIRWSMSTAMMMLMGRAVTEMRVVRRFIRKKNSTTITNSAPSSSASCRLDIDVSMKSLWRKMSVDTCTSAGRVRAMSAISRSMASVSDRVPAPCCLVTVMSTAGWPLTDAVPRRGRAPPTLTSATSATVMKPPAGSARTTVAPSSSAEVLLSSPLTMYSWP